MLSLFLNLIKEYKNNKLINIYFVNKFRKKYNKILYKIRNFARFIIKI